MGGVRGWVGGDERRGGLLWRYEMFEMRDV